MVPADIDVCLRYRELGYVGLERRLPNLREVFVSALIGTVTTKHGLVHGVKHTSEPLGCTTICKRAYPKSPLDEPGRTVTCVWCVVGKPWPNDLLMSGNPCDEIKLG